MQEKKDHLFAKQAGDYSLWYDVILFIYYDVIV